MKFAIIFFSFFFAFGQIQAQPDENYIKSLTGGVNYSWLNDIGRNLPPQQLQWTLK